MSGAQRRSHDSFPAQAASEELSSAHIVASPLRSASARPSDVARGETERDSGVRRTLPSSIETSPPASESSAGVERLRELAADACIELFAQYALPLVHVSGVIDGNRERVLSARIDFSGKGLRACCSLMANCALLEHTGAGCEPEDWIGELANQVVGRLKVSLLTFGVEVSLATPLTIWGMPPASWTRDAMKVGLFSCNCPSVELWLQVETSTEFRFDTLRPVAAACGAVFLF